jgi:hypothetical protein
VQCEMHVDVVLLVEIRLEVFSAEASTGELFCIKNQPECVVIRARLANTLAHVIGRVQLKFVWCVAVRRLRLRKRHQRVPASIVIFHGASCCRCKHDDRLVFLFMLHDHFSNAAPVARLREMRISHRQRRQHAQSSDQGKPLHGSSTTRQTDAIRNDNDCWYQQKRKVPFDDKFGPQSPCNSDKAANDDGISDED